MKLRVLIAFCVLVAGFTIHAGEAQTVGVDPLIEARVVRLAEELRCLVCQNQTIADSQAPLAVDLRQQIRVQLSQGKSEKEILTYMTERYGDFVLYRPPVKAVTWLLWFGPFVLLFAGVAGLFHVLRQRRNRALPAELSDEEHRRAENLLRAEAGNEKS